MGKLRDQLEAFIKAKETYLLDEGKFLARTEAGKFGERPNDFQNLRIRRAELAGQGTMLAQIKNLVRNLE